MINSVQFPHGLMFHRVHRAISSGLGQGSITDREFEYILHCVGLKNILSADEWLYKLKHNKLNAQDICITFDDGLKCQYEICLPILEKYSIKAFWFIYSSVFEKGLVKSEIYSYFSAKYFKDINEFFNTFFSNCDKAILAQLNEQKFKKYSRATQRLFPFYSTNDLKYRFIRNELSSQKKFENIMGKMMHNKRANISQIAKGLWFTNRDLKNISAKGHCVGLHSYNHPFRIVKLSRKKQLDEYVKNFEHIKRICNKKIVAMSHPLNSYSKVTLKILSNIGIVCGFRSNMVPPNGEKINPNCLEIAREDPVNILQKCKDKKF